LAIIKRRAEKYPGEMTVSTMCARRLEYDILRKHNPPMAKRKGKAGRQNGL